MPEDTVRADFAEGVRSFHEGRPPESEGLGAAQQAS